MAGMFLLVLIVGTTLSVLLTVIISSLSVKNKKSGCRIDSFWEVYSEKPVRPLLLQNLNRSISLCISEIRARKASINPRQRQPAHVNVVWIRFVSSSTVFRRLAKLRWNWVVEECGAIELFILLMYFPQRQHPRKWILKNYPTIWQVECLNSSTICSMDRAVTPRSVAASSLDLFWPYPFVFFFSQG